MSTKTWDAVRTHTPLGEPQRFSWSTRDSVLYALGVGAGQEDPARELAFTTDNSSVPQRVLPTMAAALAGGAGVGDTLRELDDLVDFRTMLHGDQRYEQFAELSPSGSATSVTRITGVWDKGSASVVQSQTEFTAEDSGDLLGRTTQSMFFRGAGGWGGDRGPAAVKDPDEDAAADLRIRASTRTDQPLLYRLTGDANPLHTDPAFAQRAGFPRPIMHGMCVWGIVGRLLLRELSGGDPARFGSLYARFSHPVMPGETLDIDVRHDGPTVARFTVSNPEGARVLSNGVFEYRAE